MLESNSHTNVADEIRKLINLNGSSPNDFEELQEFLQCEKNPHIFFICWLDTRSMASDETLTRYKDDDLLEFDF